MVPSGIYLRVSEDLENRGTTVQALLRAHLIATYNKRLQIYTLESVMDFGQYRGVKIEDMIRVNPDYVSWLIGNSERFTLDDDAEALLDQCMLIIQPQKAEHA